ncbi:hypothetical protein NG895_27760 [Aeoliella sp. ICT_H6.2]|uniref:Uncharacterized protein n=1 Tax=Aeoliella straminimaris TaxID=2954799 RepID=A0A9X2FG58_9BACT|nr:hypothetical protein [Aeoliella straminimaris]MCO6047718.1 hypothetical protein [Aeoliella straminimaris]
MAKAMTFGGMAVAGLSLLLFGLDLVAKFPFGRQSILIDIGFVICAGILGYLSWNAYRDL